MRALTLHRPWARVVATGEKRIENRTWRPPAKLIGQTIAIHAGRHWDRAGAIRCSRITGENYEIESQHPEGVIGLAMIVGWCDATGVIGRSAVDWDLKLSTDDRLWLTGPFGWILRDAQFLREPIPCRGFQGLWNLDASTYGQVLRAPARRP